MMKYVKMTSADFEFVARLEEEKSPETCKWLLEQLPWKVDMRHVSWSGNACFVRLGGLAHKLPFENPVRVPSKGEVLVYPGNIPYLQMGGEFFMAWGPCSFACQAGNLVGNHVLTITQGMERLEEYGRVVHLQGMQSMTVELMD